jgi:uncharacterized protein
MNWHSAAVFLLALFAYLPGPAQNSILWEISGNTLTTPSYLMGTLKFTSDEEFFIPRVAQDRLLKCSVFAIEDPVDHRAQHELNKAVHFPEGQNLKSVLSEADYDSVQRFFENEFQIPRDIFESDYAKMIPLALTITMTRLSLSDRVTFYDIEMLKMATEYKLRTVTLEEIEREAEAIRKFSTKDQVSALMRGIANFEKQKEEFNKLVKAYPNGDPAEIFQYTLHPADNNEQFVEAFYYNRNLEWLPKIEALIRAESTFIAVGLSHLEGGHGLITLLQGKGYSLTPIKLNR